MEFVAFSIYLDVLADRKDSKLSPSMSMFNVYDAGLLVDRGEQLHCQRRGIKPGNWVE